MKKVKILDKHNKTICKAIVNDKNNYKDVTLEFKGKSGIQDIRFEDLVAQLNICVQQNDENRI